MNAGFTSRNVPYDGGAQCTIALLGGHIQMSRLSFRPCLSTVAGGENTPSGRCGTQAAFGYAGYTQFT